jgi:phosphate transport system substrate-binding protein
VAHRSDGSGTTNLFTSYLKAVSPAWSTKVGAGKTVNWPVGVGGKGSDGVASIVKGSAGYIGYAELSYATSNSLSVASIGNKAGQYVAPSVAGATAAAAAGIAAISKDIRSPIIDEPGKDVYPISGFTYLLVYKTTKDASKGAALTAFLKWAMTTGQTMAAPLQYAPLPSAVVTLNNAAIAGIK